ncbi:hypothetical protein SERLA73DRAFT_70549 [Serpula lacrymans var. lacrymans S7.3]|uniref:Uncharacterized protein n=2 Tax=Serpula lacrymans var. lacrymans TaxID=341189 RepID=F8PNA6_SERL3|nr:hypothetical protein SERLA73DRAFT_70549 [Serpula lacrymans var. lacrymans S7.3]
MHLVVAHLPRRQNEMVAGEWTRGIFKRTRQTRDLIPERAQKQVHSINTLLPTPPIPPIPHPTSLNSPPPPVQPLASEATFTKLDKSGMDLAKVEILKKVFNVRGMPEWEVGGSIVTNSLDTAAHAHSIKGPPS